MICHSGESLQAGQTVIALHAGVGIVLMCVCMHVALARVKEGYF